MRSLPFAIASLIGLLLALQPARAALEQRIVAVVNDEVISEQDLNERLQLVTLTSGITDSEQARARLAPQVLRSLIEETLQLQEAERLGITVEDAEIQQALANIAERNRMTVETMQRFFEQNGIDLDTLLEQVRAQIAWVKVVNRQIVPGVTVTVDQLEMAVEDARQNEGEPEYLLSEIVLPVDSPAQAQTVAQDAARLVQTLREGASFESLAAQVSAAASAERGGDVGWVRSSAVPGELRNTLEGMREGEISDPIPSPVGYYIFWLRDRRLNETAVDSSIAGIEVDLAQILLPVDGQDDIDAVRMRAAELRDDLADCAALADAAAELDAPESGRLGWLQLGDLPPELRQAVSSLPVNQVSAPVQGPSGIHLLMVCDRREPQAVTPQREQIAERLQRERVERLARRYLRDLRKEAFVEVRL
ncbi:MAG TPA: peptidylprolyl isomerase [Geminicoccaceae bacterium]|jgi:peptidyl-prolyl cis-trans isomerase SurA|nr:peptidylprolyl isomerase [Geminicoccaceae bacterium]